MDRFTFIVFGLWIGFLMTASVVTELLRQGQIYSDRTFSVVLIISIAGIFSSALSWFFSSHFGRTTFEKSVILSAVNVFLFLVIGTLVSYIAIVVIPHIIVPHTESDHSSIIDTLMGVIFGYLGSGFSFKTFGLPLLWPLGVISGFIGTYIFISINKVLNSHAHH